MLQSFKSMCRTFLSDGYGSWKTLSYVSGMMRYYKMTFMCNIIFLELYIYVYLLFLVVIRRYVLFVNPK